MKISTKLITVACVVGLLIQPTILFLKYAQIGHCLTRADYEYQKSFSDQCRSEGKDPACEDIDVKLAHQFWRKLQSEERKCMYNYKSDPTFDYKD